MTEEKKKLPILKVKVFESPGLQSAVAEIRLAQAHSALIFNSAISEASDDE